ncbi:NAD(P)H-dependent oxidoreductase [Lactobacillus sp. LC28-10]|uniref:NAD(P)H-dependent oxidoreductase n=1 Tax=Secundilactobacillus angelensis TaxID=2722706 RepID=A0ABX1KXX6_9LACO|nr:NAD(P)H-dependent oxidoreductase [Secundilactobacillus angelensis]NLR18097.1 NAD(P)H-dependent oxidoreductase [Secundilactobacillus angelensis]
MIGGGFIKTLVVVGHPQIEDSSTQQFLKEAANLPDVIWHPVTSFAVNVAAEQALIKQADRLVLQFPLYWYSAPAILKNWLDQVLTRHFVYPAAMGGLVGKELGIAVSLGSPAKNFAAGAGEDFSISQIMIPFQALANKTQMTFLPTFIIDQFGYQSDDTKANLLIDYQRYLTQERLGHFDDKTNWLIGQLTDLITTVPEEKRQRLTLILEEIKNNQATLDDLQMNIKMIHDMED